MSRADTSPQRIEGFFSYRWLRLNNVLSTRDPANNAYNVFLAILSGITRPPRGRSPVQHYQRERNDVLTEYYKSVWADEVHTGLTQADAKQTASWRGRTAAKHLAALDEGERT